MKVWYYILIVVIGAGALALFWFSGSMKQQKQLQTQPTSQLSQENKIMQIQSSAFRANGAIPAKYTCDGENVNPPLTFVDVPGGAKSLALIMDDPDVPKNLKPDGVFDHWVVFNMPADTSGIGENSVPPGVQSNNGAGKAEYTGPCPPDREHRYFFKLYALDMMLDLPTGASKAEVAQAMQGHIAAQAELVGRYNRPANQK